MKKTIYLLFITVLINIIFVSFVWAQSEKTEQKRPKPTLYYMVLLDIGEKWRDSDVSILRNPALEKSMREHSKYMDQMSESGSLVLGGPFLDNLEMFMQKRSINGGMLLYKTTTLQETEEILRKDPIIKSGAMTVKAIKPLIIFVGGDKPIK